MTSRSTGDGLSSMIVLSVKLQRPTTVLCANQRWSSMRVLSVNHAAMQLCDFSQCQPAMELYDSFQSLSVMQNFIVVLSVNQRCSFMIVLNAD